MNLNSLFSLLLDRSPRRLLSDMKFKMGRGTRLQAFDAQFPCVFVLSTGRVGTKSLANVLDIANNVQAHHEPRPLIFALSRRAYEVADEELCMEILGDCFLVTRKELFDQAKLQGKGYVETSPQVTFLAPIIAAIMPQARFIHLVRDPRAVVRSGMRRAWYDGHPLDEWRIEPRDQVVEGSDWSGLTPFEKNIWLWRETNRFILNFTATLAPERSLLLRSESLFAVEMESFNQLFTFVGATPPNEASLHKKMRVPENQQTKGVFAPPSEWTDAMNDDLHRLASGEMLQLGYA